MATFLTILVSILLIITAVVAGKIRKQAQTQEIDPIKAENAQKAELFDEWVSVRNVGAFIL